MKVNKMTRARVRALLLELRERQWGAAKCQVEHLMMAAGSPPRLTRDEWDVLLAVVWSMLNIETILESRPQLLPGLRKKKKG